MKLADKFPFAANLTGSRHQISLRRDDATVGTDEVEVDRTWDIRVESQHPILERAAGDLGSFLARAMETPMEAGNPTRSIVLSVDPSVSQEAETHVIDVSADGIKLTGAGPEGVLRGVLYIEQIMKERGGPFVPTGEHKRRPLFAPRVHRSPLSPFYVEELTGYNGPPFVSEWRDAEHEYHAYESEDAGPETFYNDNMLLTLAEHGASGIWIRGALRHFARVDVFPEFGRRSHEILAKLRDLCKRATNNGLKVFLYINEPMGLDEDDPFWDKYPHVRGVTSQMLPVSHMCTSTQEVKTYLHQASEYVFSEVADLAGMILVTASEYPSHCYSHQTRPGEHTELQDFLGEGQVCPRCAERKPQEVVAEVIQLLRDGAKTANPDAQIIAWNWSWSFYEDDPQPGILERLPDDVIIMAGFERGDPTTALGFNYTNDEYSIKVVGPSSRFRGTMKYQREHGRPMYAKLQLGTTHENPTVPYLPALYKVAAKYKALNEHNVAGIMTCWNFGNMPSLATEVANEFSWDPQPNVEEGLMRVARRNFGPDAAPDAVAGWKIISEAQNDFPGSIPVLYYGPISRGPAFHFVWEQIDRKFPCSWMLDTAVEGDRLEDCTSPFGPEKVMDCYRAVAQGWARGIARMEEGLPKAKGSDRQRLEREIGVVKMGRIQLNSAANVIDFLMVRDDMYAEEDPQRKRRLLDRLEKICRNEMENARSAIPLCVADSRLGFHGEAYGYMFNQELIAEKLDGLKEIIDKRIPDERQNL